MQTAESHDAAVSVAIAAMAECEFGWDGGGGLPLREDVARTMSHVFSRRCSVGFDGVGYPDIALCHDGTAEFVYAHDGRELVLHFQCDSVIEYVSRNTRTDFESSGIIRLDRRLGVLAMAEAVGWLKGK